MAIRKDLDEMLNNLKNAGGAASSPDKSRSSAAKPAPRKSVYDNMSVEELLNALSQEKPKKPTAEEEAAAKAAEEAARKAEEESLAEEARRAERIRQIEENRRAEEERRAAEAARQAEEERLAEEARKADEARRAEKIRLTREARKAEEKRLAEEAARKAEEKRLAEEAARKAEEERLAEEAARKAEEKRLAEEAARKAEEERLAEEAARKAEEERLAEEAARKAEEERLAEEARKAEEAYIAEEKQLMQLENEADEFERELAELAAKEANKKGLFKKIKGMFSKDSRDDVADEDEEYDEESEYDDTDTQEESPETFEADSEAEADETVHKPESAVELVTAAIASIEEYNLEMAQEENAEDKTSAIPEAEAEIVDDDEAESDPVAEMIDGIRGEAAEAIADISGKGGNYTITEEKPEENAPENDEQEDDTAEIDVSVEGVKEKGKGKLVSTLERILDESPDKIMNERSEKTEADSSGTDAVKSSGRFKKVFYALLGVVFTLFAIVGMAAVVSKGILYVRSFTAGEDKKDSFRDIVYPAVIMDIESFESPSDLSSDQIISAALWSLVMNDEELAKYTATFDVVSVPSVDVEAYAAKLFGSSIPQLEHTTVGSGELKFYYNEDTKAYNVPVKPITFTYEPKIKSVAKNGNDYTVDVDYVSELPAWLKDKSEENEGSEDISKSVQFKLTDNNGQYSIDSMKILFVKNDK